MHYALLNDSRILTFFRILIADIRSQHYNIESLTEGKEPLGYTFRFFFELLKIFISVIAVKEAVNVILYILVYPGPFTRHVYLIRFIIL